MKISQALYVLGYAVGLSTANELLGEALPFRLLSGQASGPGVVTIQNGNVGVNSGFDVPHKIKSPWPVVTDPQTLEPAVLDLNLALRHIADMANLFFDDNNGFSTEFGTKVDATVISTGTRGLGTVRFNRTVSVSECVVLGRVGSVVM